MAGFSAVLAAVFSSCGAGPPGTLGPPATPAGPTAGSSTPVPGTPVPGTSSTTSAPPVTTPGGTSTTSPPAADTTAPPATLLRLGDSGPAVKALQERLEALGYWLPAPDGVFGDATQQAVYALQKAAGIARDGVVGPVTEAALAAGVVPHPRSTSGHVIEVDLGDDLLMVVTDGRLQAILNTSTGGGYEYTSDGVTAVADTPTGHFTIIRQVDGMVVSPLGELWRPKYFYGGYALHGYPYVPPYPVSHGCVRVSNAAINWMWSAGVAPLGTVFWVY